VLVSGCHPGDCHYTTGNYHARRRWALFRKLLALTGIDETPPSISVGCRPPKARSSPT